MDYFIRLHSIIRFGFHDTHFYSNTFKSQPKINMFSLQISLESITISSFISRKVIVCKLRTVIYSFPFPFVINTTQKPFVFLFLSCCLQNVFLQYLPFFFFLIKKLLNNKNRRRQMQFR